MKKLEYISGDFTTWLGRKVRIDGVIVDPNTKQIDYYEIADTGSESVFQGEDLKPIKLTRTILKNNGWKKTKESFKTQSYYKKNFGVNTITIIAINEDFSVVYNTTCIRYIQYVHELQHLLFGLGLNSEIEV